MSELASVPNSGDDGEVQADLATPARRPRNAVKTRNDILTAAEQRFSRIAYARVTLKDIADDAGVTPALVARYFGNKRALFQAVVKSREMVLAPLGDGDFKEQMEERARAIVEFFQDRTARAPGIALLRSLDLDDGELFRAELERRLVTPWSTEISGQDAEVRLRLVAGLLFGVGLFSLGALTEPDRPPLGRADADATMRYLAEMLAVCMVDPSAESHGGTQSWAVG